MKIVPAFFNSIRINSLISASLLALTAAVPAVAAEYDDETMPAQPAELTDKKSSLQNQIQFPQIDTDVSITLLCDTTVSDRGRLQNTLCDSQNLEEERFEREVVEAARDSRIDPATLTGRRVPVRMNFAVIFEKRNGVENVQVFLHHFRNSQQLGNDYIAAQRFMTIPNECPRLYVPIWMAADVMATGSAFNVSVFSQGDSSEVDVETMNSCIRSFTTTLTDNLYIPTIYQGRYVNGKYIELFYTRPRDRF